jgi:hypothetical protein
MRGVLIGTAVLAGWLAGCPGARAGLYNSQENIPPIPPEKIKFWVGQLRGIAVERKGQPEEGGSLRAKFLDEVARLEGLRREGAVSTIDRADLGACYVRLRKPSEAIRVLRQGDQSHFLIQANLATAYFLQGDVRMALRYQQRLLANWPTVWLGSTPQQLIRLRRAETYFRKLLESRLAEEERRGAGGGGFGGPEVPVDPLFPGLKFVGPSGRYEAGALAMEMWDKLPEDGSNVVLQLVLWTPWDDRLYWLLAELINVNGYVEPAYSILAELRDVGVGGGFQDLHAHRKVLREAVDAYRNWYPQPGDPEPKKRRGFLLSALTPPPLLAPGPAGAAAQQAGATVAAQKGLLPSEEPPDTQPDPADAQAGGRPFGWWHLLIAFAAGALVSALVALQWQEWRRRRPAPFAAPPLPPEDEAAPPPDRPLRTRLHQGPTR